MASPNTSSDTSTGSNQGVFGAAQGATERVREEGGRIAGQAKEQAKSLLSDQKGLAAERIENFAGALRETVDRLDDTAPSAITDYARRAVDTLDNAASSLREKDLDTLISDAENFARRQPILFIAGSVIAGFALARFLKSSSQRRAGSYGYGGDTDYGQGRGGYRDLRSTDAASENAGTRGGQSYRSRETM